MENLINAAELCLDIAPSHCCMQANAIKDSKDENAQLRRLFLFKKTQSRFDMPLTDTRPAVAFELR